jgi:hypothetical protein
VCWRGGGGGGEKKGEHFVERFQMPRKASGIVKKCF